MITQKSKREIELMRKAGEIVALAHQAVAKAIRPGITTYEIDQIVEKVILDNQATPSFKGYNVFHPLPVLQLMMYWYMVFLVNKS